ncbi:MAG: RuBisCO large subunit C-terminal-like domain-containing protein [Bacillota bacterium]
MRPEVAGANPAASPAAESGFFLATYLLTGSGDLRKAAEFIAREESAGAWVGAGQQTELHRRALAEVADFRQLGDRRALATIAFPLLNLTIDRYVLANIWLFMTGGPLFERAFVDRVRLVDVTLPDEVLRVLPGPRYGVDGTRRLLRADPGRPLLGTIVKPCAGLTAQEVAQRVIEAARAGVDLIKDDEKMNNPAYCPLEDRIRLVAEGLGRLHEETGRRVIYCPHVSSRPDRALQLARRARDAGATGLMLNPIASGFAALQMIAESDVDLPIYAHTGGRTAWSRLEGYGIDPAVVAKWVRLSGGDYMDVYARGGYLLNGTQDQARAVVAALRDPMGPVARALPAYSGGLNTANLGENLDFFGLDALPMAGSAILDHPMGIEAGVRAFWQAVEAWRLGAGVAEYARQHRELAAALEVAFSQGSYRA